MRKVLIFSLNFFPKYVGGAEVAIKEVVERLNKDKDENGDFKFEFHMITLRFDSDLPKYEFLHGIHIHRIGFTKKEASISDIKKFPLHINKYYYQVFAFLKAMQLHWQYNFNFTWAMMAHSCGVPAGIFKFFFPKVIYTLNLQEGDPPEQIEHLAKPFPNFLPFNLLNKISFWFFQNAFRNADVTFSLSTYLQNWAKKMGTENRNIVIPNAVNYQKFSQNFALQEIQEVQNNLLHKRVNDIWLVTTSRLVYKNAVDDVINSLIFLPENVKFLIIGIGPEEGKLKKLTNQNNLNNEYNNRVIFAGEIKNAELPKILQACDIFIRPSRSEGFGISFVEAMAAGVPVVATLEGGISDFLFDKSTGYVCEKNSPKSIANAVETIIGNPELKRQVVINAKKMVQEKYDWDVITKQIEYKVFEVN